MNKSYTFFKQIERHIYFSIYLFLHANIGAETLVRIYWNLHYSYLLDIPSDWYNYPGCIGLISFDLDAYDINKDNKDPDYVDDPQFLNTEELRVCIQNHLDEFNIDLDAMFENESNPE